MTVETREQQLLLLCARSGPAAVATDIQALIDDECSGGVDWIRFAESAADHRVLPLIHRTLKRTCADRVPAPVMQAIERQCAAIGTRNLHLTGELKRLIGRFAARGIPVIAFKGPLLAVDLYGGLAGRPFHDLDLLVKPADYTAGMDLLRCEGYEPGDDWGYECSWIRGSDAVRVDLHRGLAHAALPFPIDFDRLYGRLEQRTGMLAGVGFLGPADTLIMLCVQLAKDASGESLRLAKLCDIAELLRARPEMDWRAVHEESRRLGCERVVAFALLCARELLGAPAPAFSHAGFDEAGLMKHVRARLFCAGTSGDSQLTFEQFHAKVRERWRDRLYPYYHRAVTPNRKDRAMLVLPEALDFLYYLIRPVRVLSDSAKSLARQLTTK